MNNAGGAQRHDKTQLGQQHGANSHLGSSIDARDFGCEPHASERNSELIADGGEFGIGRNWC